MISVSGYIGGLDWSNPIQWQYIQPSGYVGSGITFNSQKIEPKFFDTWIMAKCYACGKFFKAVEFQFQEDTCPHCGAQGYT